MLTDTQIILRLSLSVVLSGLIGIESLVPEHHRKKSDKKCKYCKSANHHYSE